VVLLAAIFAAAVAGIAVLAVPDAQVETTPDSLGYLAVARGLAAHDAHALVSNRAFLYPLLLALQRATGLSHYLVVSLFNLAALTLLVWRLYVRGPHGAAVATAAVGLVLLLSAPNIDYSSVYLRESVVLGVTALHLALLIEALRGPWQLPARLGFTAAALLVAYHFKGLYAYVFAVAGPLLLWPQLRAAGWRASWRPAAVAVVAAVVLVAATWATNPANDARQKDMTLLGVLVNSDVPQYYMRSQERLEDPHAASDLTFIFYAVFNIRREESRTGLPHDRISPFEVDRRYRERYGTSLAARSRDLLLDVAADKPWAFAWFLVNRLTTYLPQVWLSGLPGRSVCGSYWGIRRGLSEEACRPLAWTVAAAWGVLPLLALFVWVARRRLAPEGVAALGLVGMGAGLALMLGEVGYSDLGRLNLAPFMYGALALPAALGMLAEAARRPKPATGGSGP
jgi:hypothetical protein